MGLETLVIVFWTIISLLVIIEYTPHCRGLDTWGKIAAFLIFAIGGPVFAVSNILTAILDEILPGGWNDDDN